MDSIYIYKYIYINIYKYIDFDKVAKSVAACDISGLGRRIIFACIFVKWNPVNRCVLN